MAAGTRVPAPRVTALGGVLGPIKAFLDWLYKYVPAALATVDSHEEAIDSHEETIDDHETRIDDLESATPVADPQIIAWRSGGLNLNAGTWYFDPWYDPDGTAGTSERRGQLLWGKAGTFRNLRVKFPSVSSDADVAVITLRINGASTALTVSAPGDSTSMVSDTTHDVAVEVGDLIAMQLSQSAGISGIDTVLVTWEFSPS